MRAHGYDGSRRPMVIEPAIVSLGSRSRSISPIWARLIGVMQGQDAVIHLAAIPSPDAHTAEVVFRTNVMSTFNVLEAATILGISNITMASSISALGYAFRHRPFQSLVLAD